MNVCMFPAESYPAEGGVISLTSTAQMTPRAHVEITQEGAHTLTERQKQSHWYVVITPFFLLAA